MGCVSSKTSSPKKYSAPDASLHREKIAQAHQQRLDSSIQHKINLHHIKMRKSIPILPNQRDDRKNQEIIDGWGV